MTHRIEDVRKRAQRILQGANVLLEGHFDFGNGYHGRTYLNPHMLFCQPSTIWQLAQDLLDVLPYDVSTRVQAVVGPATGGALLAHTIAGLLDGRRALTHPPCSFAPFTLEAGAYSLRSFYARHMQGRMVLIADDVRNTGSTLQRCAELVRDAGGFPVATLQICDRMEAVVDAGVPNFALVEYPAPENYSAADCPMCRAGEPITTF